MTITPIYVGLLALLFFWMSLRISLLRMKGYREDNEHAAALRIAVRAQGNASEYIPLGLISLIAVEALGGPVWLIHALGQLLLGGRVGHFLGFGLGWSMPLRRISSVATYLNLLLSGIAVLWLALGS